MLCFPGKPTLYNVNLMPALYTRRWSINDNGNFLFNIHRLVSVLEIVVCCFNNCGKRLRYTTDLRN